MVAENECLKNEEGPFPEPTPEERDLPLGKRGELAAVRFLSRKGYEILETNWTCVAGEADIIRFGRGHPVLCRGEDEI